MLIAYHSTLFTSLLSPPNQFGGKPFSSTADAGVSLMSFMLKLKKKHPSHNFSILTMDIKGFFDSLSHSRLIHLLYHFGFPSKICRWVVSFLSSRRISFNINGSTSSAFKLSNIGIPQGSPLSPILSVIYTALTISAFRLPNAIAFSYIDDIAILYHYSSPSQAHTLIHNSFYFFKDQLRLQGLFLDLSKTELIHFFKKFNPARTPSMSFSFLDYDSNPFHVNHYPMLRWLGFYFLRDKSFKLHTSFMARKALSAFFSLRMFLSSLVGLSPHHLRHIYISCVVPILFYGFQLWYNPASPPKSIISSLQKIQNKCLVKISGAFKTSPTTFLHNFLSIPYVSDLLKQRYFKYCHSTRTSRPSSYWPSAIIDSFDNPFYLPLTSFYSDHSTFFEKASICPFPPSSLPLDCAFPSRFSIINKAGIKGKDWDKLIEDINSSIHSSPKTIFFFTDGSATLTSSVAYRGRSSYWLRRNVTGCAVIIYHNGLAIGSRKDRLSPTSTAFDAEIFAITKALQLLKAKLLLSPSLNIPILKKAILYTDSSSSLKLLSKNPTAFIHHSAYVKIFKLVSDILSSNPSFSISFIWCPAHKGVKGNEEVDYLAGKAAASPLPNSTPITASFCNLISTKDLLDSCTYYWEAFKEKPGPYSPSFMALTYPSLKVKSLYKELLQDRPLCLRFVRIATEHCFCGKYYRHFNIPEPYNCPCNNAPIQDIEHLLYDCSLITPSLYRINFSIPSTPWCDPFFCTKFGLKLLLNFLVSNSIGLKPPVHI